MDDSDRRLSDQQKACLRLVGRGMTSREIAIETGLAPLTVDTYVKAAMARLGASNRRDAARRLAELELPPRSGSPSPPLGTGRPPGQADAVAAGRGWIAWFVPPPLGGRPNTLGAAERTFAVLRVSLVGVVVVLALALVIAGALRTFR